MCERKFAPIISQPQPGRRLGYDFQCFFALAIIPVKEPVQKNTPPPHSNVEEKQKQRRRVIDDVEEVYQKTTAIINVLLFDWVLSLV